MQHCIFDPVKHGVQFPTAHFFGMAVVVDSGTKMEKMERNLMSKPYLGDCPKKKRLPVCGCLELIHFAGDDSELHQDRMRQMYVTAVKEGGLADGNEFLIGCFLPNSDGRAFSHRVPCLSKEEGVSCHRSYLLCAKQFKQLFSLTESRFQRLRDKRNASQKSTCKFGFRKAIVEGSDWADTDLYYWKGENYKCRLSGWSFYCYKRTCRMSGTHRF